MSETPICPKCGVRPKRVLYSCPALCGTCGTELPGTGIKVVREEDAYQAERAFWLAYGLLHGADGGFVAIESTRRESSDVNHVLIRIAGVEIAVFDDSEWDYVAWVKVGERRFDVTWENFARLHEFIPKHAGPLEKAFNETPWVEPT